MSSTRDQLMKYILAIPAQRIFTTREVLLFGKRSTIDVTLWRLVQEGYLERLARGVFRKWKHNSPPVPIEEVARIKAQAFCRRIRTDVSAVARRFDSACISREIIFATNGRSSSFEVGDVRVYLRSVAPRKLALAKDETGRVLHNCWHIKNHYYTILLLTKLSEILPTQKVRTELLRHARLIPAWMNNWLHKNLAPIHLMAPPSFCAPATRQGIPEHLFLS